MDWKKLIADLQASGVTQVQMAQKCKCAQTTISDILNGRIEHPRYEIGAALVAMLPKRRRSELSPKDGCNA